MLLCNDERRLVQPVVVSDVDWGACDAERHRRIGVAVQAMGDHGSLLVAIARRDNLSITAQDRAWARAAQFVCGDAVPFLGLHVVTIDGSRVVPLDDAAA